MSGRDIGKLTRELFSLLLLTLVACSETGTAPPLESDSDDPENYQLEFISDLTLSIQSMLIETPADLDARVRFTLPTFLVLDGVTLFSVDEAGTPDSMIISPLLDSGEAASGDMAAGDDIYSTTLTGLIYDTPLTERLAVLVEYSDTLGHESWSRWSEIAAVNVLGLELIFDSAPLITPGGAFVYDSNSFTINSILSVADSLELESVKIYRVNESGDSLMFKSYLVDNGDLNNADEIDGDGVYSALLPDMTFFAAHPFRLRALAKAVSPTSGLIYETWSDIRTVAVNYRLAFSLVTQVTAILDSVEIRYNLHLVEGLSPQVAAETVLTWLEERPRVLYAYISPNEDAIWARFNMGIEGGVLLPVPEGRPVYGAGSGRQGISLSLQAQDRGTANFDRHPFQDRDMDNPDEVHSNMIMLLSPLHSWIDEQTGESDPCSELTELLTSLECPSYDVDYLPDENATVAKFADLERYGGVCLITHGTLMAGGQVCLMTGEQVNEETVEAFNWDLRADDPTLVILHHQGRNLFAVKSGFFENHIRRLPNSVITISACQSMVNNSLRLTLLGKGAGYVGGFSDEVTVTFGNDCTLEFWESLIEGTGTAGDAYLNLSEIEDPYRAGTEFVVHGNQDLHFGSDFQNGSFELRTLAAWRSEGDGRVISQLGVERPFDGSAMGIISTGLGYTVATGEISQRVCVPPGTSTLNFAYNFFSEEFLEWCDSQFQDYLEVSIALPEQEPEELFFIHIADMCDDVVQVDTRFDMGDVYKTGWRQLSLDISGYGGRTVIIRFAAGDIGDSIYDSAILIDSITID